MPVTLPETIVRRRCAALIPCARNARTHSDQQVAQVAASMREFGFTNPVLIVLAHLTPTQRRAYVLAS